MAKGKGLVYRLTMGRDDRPDFDVSKLPSNRFQLFKDVFFSRLGAIIKINLLVLLFAFPAIVIVYLFTVVIIPIHISTLPYSGNLGIGYPQVENLSLEVSAITLMYNFMMFALLIPAIVVAAIGLAGGFNVIKLLAWGEGVNVFAHFFSGIKKHFRQFFLFGLVFAFLVSIIAFNLQFFTDMTENPLPFNFPVGALRIFGIAFCIISIIILTCMIMFVTTQAATYKLKLWGLFKNSFLLSVALLPKNLLIIGISIIPVVIMIMPIPLVAPIGMLFMLMVGFSFIILLWTVYAHYVFDKYINDRVEGAEKNKGLHIQTEEEKQAKEEHRRKAANVRFANPKKKKPVTSVEEGSTFEPLAATFNRADLHRLAEEKEQVKQEIDKEYEDVDNEANETEDKI